MRVEVAGLWIVQWRCRGTHLDMRVNHIHCAACRSLSLEQTPFLMSYPSHGGIMHALDYPLELRYHHVDFCIGRAKTLLQHVPAEASCKLWLPKTRRASLCGKLCERPWTRKWRQTPMFVSLVCSDQPALCAMQWLFWHFKQCSAHSAVQERMLVTMEDLTRSPMTCTKSMATFGF